MNDKPGINSTSFKVGFNSNNWNCKYKVNNSPYYWYKFLDLIGCTPIYQTKVLDKPVLRNGDYIYTIKIMTKVIRIFGIKVKTLKYNNTQERNFYKKEKL